MTTINTRDENSAPAEARAGASDLTEAADRAGAIVTEQIRAMLEAAEKRALEIRKSAEKDAREVRQGAATEAGTLFEKLEALEAPLDALVSSLRGELDSLSSEFRRHWTDEEIVMHAAPGNGDGPTAYRDAPEAEDDSSASAETAQHQVMPEEPEPEEAEPDEAEADEPEAEEPQADEPQSAETTEHQAVEPEPEAEAEAEPAPEEQEPDQPEPVHHEADDSHAAEDHAAKKRGPLGWLKRRKSALFVTTPGQCAVCYRSYAAGSEEALAESGWKVSGELGLCPDCQNDGWQLPEGARLPYRRAAG